MSIYALSTNGKKSWKMIQDPWKNPDCCQNLIPDWAMLHLSITFADILYTRNDYTCTQTHTHLQYIISCCPAESCDPVDSTADNKIADMWMNRTHAVTTVNWSIDLVQCQIFIIFLFPYKWHQVDARQPQDEEAMKVSPVHGNDDDDTDDDATYANRCTDNYTNFPVSESTWKQHAS